MNNIPLKKVIFLNSLIEGLQLRFNISAVYLFGSYVNGTPSLWSDLDVIVISKDFEPVDVTTRRFLIAVVKNERLIRGLDVKAVSELEWTQGFGFLGHVKKTAKNWR